ncbi:aconitate hydratase mitochondrial precursor [Syncephalis fuscata]|nr:aconitate hydratase mitochondrial precursor [Syncephalis fuscata]
MYRLRQWYRTGSSRVSIGSRTMATAVTQQGHPVPDYTRFQTNLQAVRGQLDQRPLTLAEKILYSHLTDVNRAHGLVRGESYLKLSPDRVAMQDASAQMAILQFMLSGLPTTAVPTSVHCDHLIVARDGAEQDVATAEETSHEIFEFLDSASRKYGMHFWKPGSGIIHQIVLENYAAPGTLMLGTDSHTPNAGGLGMLAIGVGGADAVDAMAAIPWELKAPKILGVRLDGQLNGWTSPKDVILHLAGQLTVRGGTGHIIEYFGPGVASLSCTGMATICNMGAEVGATTSVFPYGENMQRYLQATQRAEIAKAADKVAADYLRADKACHDDPSRYYDRVIDIDLSKLEPHLNGPFTPDLSTPLSQFKEVIKKNGWKDEVRTGLIGSCTNSSYEDMSRVVSVASQAEKRGLKMKSQFLVTPGSEQIRATAERDGHAQTLRSVGGQMLANACGPCIGQWDRSSIKDQEQNAIVTSFNRNFRSRNDGNPNTMNFLASPEIVTAMALSGKLSFNPVTDSLTDEQGRSFQLTPPSGDELPREGFATGNASYKPPSEAKADANQSVVIDPASARLQVLDPFPAWSGEELTDLRVLVRAQGKCTTDHISAAGPWLKYKGHLENISNNTLIGATNADNGKVNSAINAVTGKEDTIPEVAKQYKAADIPWLIVADHNYGEGSAREHAAMQPRYLGGRLIVARSFARIHETNLKKQGILPLTFVNEDDYQWFTNNSVVSTRGLVDLVNQTNGNNTVSLVITTPDGKERVISTNHTMSADQLEWFRHGSALNRIAALSQ